MADENGVLKLRLKSGEEKRLLRGHPWVFSNELKKVPTDAAPGSPAIIVSSAGKPLGAGFFNPKSLIAFRLLARKPREFNKEFFKEKFTAARNFRGRFLDTSGSYRLCYGESDGLPGLVVDKFEGVLVLQVLAAGMELLLPAIKDALVELFEPEAIHLKNDHPLRKLEGLPLEDATIHGEVPDQVEIVENGVKYAVGIKGGQKTGFYFDQRENRAVLAPYYKGRRVLDFYCFSGSFALNAGKNGAAEVYGLDSSEEAVRLATRNAALNGLSKKVKFDVGDAQEVLESLSEGKQSMTPDMILLDPPSFAASKKHVVQALRALSNLNGMALRSLHPGGLLATSTCSHHISREAFLGMIRHAAGKSGKAVRRLMLRGQAADHPVLVAMPETEYLHFCLLEVL